MRLEIKYARGQPELFLALCLENAEGFDRLKPVGIKWDGADVTFTQPPEDGSWVGIVGPYEPAVADADIQAIRCK